MRIIQTLFGFIFMVLTTTTVSAQYGNNGYGNNGYGGNGYGRNGGMSQMNQRNQDGPKEIPIEETVSEIMVSLTKELNLDVLQEIAITNVFTESVRKQTALIKAQINQEEKIKEFQALSEITDQKVIVFLNNEQKEKYKILNEESKNPKKSKKKKR